jgi:hypothetical protein
MADQLGEKRNQAWQERCSPWVAAAFAACLSLMTLVIANERNQVGSLGAFLSFLPMCFYFSALPIVSLRKQVQELQRRLDAYERG